MNGDIATLEMAIVLNFTFILVRFLKHQQQALEFLSQGLLIANLKL